MITPAMSTGQVDVTESDLRYGMFTELDAKARRIEKQFKETWVELADIMATMRDGSYWREGGFTSLHSWIISAMPCSRSWAYLALGVREDLKEMSDEDLKQMPLSNAEVLRKLPKNARTAKETIEAAQTLTPAEFLPRIATEQPDLALETKVKLRFTTTMSQADTIHRAIAKMQGSQEVKISDVEALEYICIEYLLEPEPEIDEAQA